MTSFAPVELLEAVGARRLEPHRQLRGHDFFPPAAELATVPSVAHAVQTPIDERLIVLHYFTEHSDWWICGLDPRTGEAYGYICHAGLKPAWSRTWLNDLCSLDVIVSRDLAWQPKPARYCSLRSRTAS